MCQTEFNCWRLWTVLEIGEFFRVSRPTVIKWQDQGELRYRLRLTNRGRVKYVRVTDSQQMSDFLMRKLPQQNELDPTISANHRKLIWLRAKARRRSAAGLQVQRQRRDPTLRPVPSENLGPSIDEVDRSEPEQTPNMGENEEPKREMEEES